MKILVVGHGGREHALLHIIRRDAPAAELFITRGNGGTAALATHVPLDPSRGDEVAAWCAANGIDLVVVGPEAPLAAGIIDVLTRRGVAAFGPSASGARIEASKAFAKAIMTRADVPTASYARVTDFSDAERRLRAMNGHAVVKASGLAAGKGAIVCTSLDEALDAARRMLSDREFGDAGAEVVIEEVLEGEELSVFALTDGTDMLLMPPAQDHKRIGEGDTGPNTGGMGAYAPVPGIEAALIDRVRDTVFDPTLAELRRAGSPFRGLLYAGLMLTADGPKVIEFNCRFGDPETQALLPLLDSSLLEPMLAIARGGSLRDMELRWKPAYALTTVLAAGGYPGPVAKGAPISMPSTFEPGVTVFHAGTRLDGDRLVTDGGRVLAVTALGETLEEAARRSRAAAESIEFEGRQFRRDIGWRALARA